MRSDVAVGAAVDVLKYPNVVVLDTTEVIVVIVVLNITEVVVLTRPEVMVGCGMVVLRESNVLVAVVFNKFDVELKYPDVTVGSGMVELNKSVRVAFVGIDVVMLK